MPEVTHVEVELDGQRHRLGWPPEQRLVDTLLAAGIAVPHSCREGWCGSCVVAGRVDMAPCDVLDTADVEDGLILACQARAAGVDVHVAF
jgi:3-ketosteroid 9alpha-monooxygenase subunit B